uniref:Secreted protein n=1 Tax=Globodera pallida TaxID=36090 RepID=A0A183BMX6_GLOPA
MIFWTTVFITVLVKHAADAGANETDDKKKTFDDELNELRQKLKQMTLQNGQLKERNVQLVNENLLNAAGQEANMTRVTALVSNATANVSSPMKESENHILWTIMIGSFILTFGFESHFCWTTVFVACTPMLCQHTVIVCRYGPEHLKRGHWRCLDYMLCWIVLDHVCVQREPQRRAEIASVEIAKAFQHRRLGT